MTTTNKDHTHSFNLLGKLCRVLCWINVGKLIVCWHVNVFSLYLCTTVTTTFRQMKTIFDIVFCNVEALFGESSMLAILNSTVHMRYVQGLSVPIPFAFLFLGMFYYSHTFCWTEIRPMLRKLFVFTHCSLSSFLFPFRFSLMLLLLIFLLDFPSFGYSDLI